MFGLPLSALFNGAMLLLKIAKQILDKMERERMISLGAKEQIAQNVAEMQVSLKITNEVDAYVKKLSDSELDDILAGDK